LLSATLIVVGRSWSEVEAMELVKRRAERLLKVHPLRTADALQLGAALLATQEQPQGINFVSYDQNLAAAAHKEGLRFYLPVERQGNG